MHERRQYEELWEQLDRWGTFILANLLWVVLALPLITLPAATAGLFAVMSRRARGQQPELFRVFFGAMRQYWWRALALALADVLLFGLIAVNLRLFPLMSITDPLAWMSGSVTLAAGLVLLLANLYVWPLLILFDLPLRPLATMALKLVFAHPLESLGVLAAALVPVLISVLLPRAVFLFVTVALCAYIICWGTWRVLRPHLSEDELQALEIRQRL